MEVTGADPGSFLGGGALVSCSTSTPINHIVFFLHTVERMLRLTIIYWISSNLITFSNLK